jgi:hypothetical protein
MDEFKREAVKLVKQPGAKVTFPVLRKNGIKLPGKVIAGYLWPRPWSQAGVTEGETGQARGVEAPWTATLHVRPLPRWPLPGRGLSGTSPVALA